MNQKNEWRKRLGDLKSAHARLAEALKQNEFSNLEKDGVIQRFEFTLELAWKTMRDYLEDQGITDINSPKKTIRKAFQVGLFSDGELWLNMLEDRNQLSHLYKQAMSDSIFEKIKNNYSVAIGDMIKKLEKE